MNNTQEILFLGILFASEMLILKSYLQVKLLLISCVIWAKYYLSWQFNFYTPLPSQALGQTPNLGKNKHRRVGSSPDNMHPRHPGMIQLDLRFCNVM